MGKYRGGPKPWEKDDPKGRRLDPGQYPELNAVFYTADPAEFIKMRIESLSLMAASDEQLTPAFAADKMIGSAHFGPMTVPTQNARERYVRMESVMIAHHASEALLRLFFAHIEHQECPWLGMSASTDFGEFKRKINAALDSGFVREQIAMVFLGGASPTDACLRLSDIEFEDAVDGLDILLIDCANRFLDDSFLYNAVKHGVTAIGIDDDEAQLAWTSHTGERTTLHKGPVHIYLHKKASPDADKNDAQWFFSTDDPNPSRDLSVSVLVTKAVDSLWDVARRRYMGESGSITYISKAAVELAIYGTTMQAMNLLKRMTSELIKLKPDGTNDGTDHHMVGYHIPEDWSLHAANEAAQTRTVPLPVREQDRQLYSTSTRAYLPITPRGFQRG
ncbi:MAG: hypothetical protein ACLP9Y_32450 [Mycobacterium sp.]